MKSILRDVFGLFFPPTCAACDEPLSEGSDFICTECRWEIPFTGFLSEADNPVARKFHGSLPIVNACSFVYFVHDSNFRTLIHKLKYSGGWRIGVRMGEWLGSELKESKLYDSVDVILPIPLHTRKLLKRGYNQAEYIAQGVSKAMGIPVDTRSVIRTVHNDSQTSLDKDDRWDNVRDIFSLRHPERLRGKHIMLIDDVLTTGSTLISCGEAILRTLPDCRLSIVTLAIPRGRSEGAELGGASLRNER